MAKLRNEMQSEFTWNLADLFASDEAWENKLSETKEYINKIIKFIENIT